MFDIVYALSTVQILGLSFVVLLFGNYLKNYIQLRSYFSSRNIPGPKPLPLFGNFIGVVRQGFVYPRLEFG